jgi:hypothetical protein
MNTCEMIVNFAIDKINVLLKKIIEQYEEYINNMITLIKTKSKITHLNEKKKKSILKIFLIHIKILKAILLRLKLK